MKLRTHVSSALAVAPIVAFTTGGFHLLLMGSVFPDTDLIVKEKGHRYSLLHTIEIPLAGFLLLRFVKIPYMFGFPVGYLARCFFAGWLVHLLGDFLQGGVRSLIFGRKVGFKNFNWNRYCDTPAGFGIDLLLTVVGLFGLYRYVARWKDPFVIVSVLAAYSGDAFKVFIRLTALMAGVLYLAKVF